jgi:AraC family transcriptional regulator, exoenzyme S synthesis regulatory protein ExsA
MTIDLQLRAGIERSQALTMDATLERRLMETDSRETDLRFDAPAVLVLVNGRETISWNDQSISLSAGQAIFAAPRNYRTSIETEHCESIAICFRPEFITAFVNRHAGGLSEPDNCAQAVDAAFLLRLTPFLKSAVESLPVFLGAERPPSKQLIALKLDELVLALVDADCRVWPQLRASCRHDWRLVDYVATRRWRHESLNDLARGAGQSLSTFKRHFRAATGVPPASWLRNQRLARAKQLLQSSDRSVTDIAYDVGFSSVSHFVHTFRRRYQVTPQRIRVKQKERSVHG